MTVVVFSGRHSLNDDVLRANLIRIPEVLSEIKGAQKILDQMEIQTDLLEQMSLPTEEFCRKLAVRAALTNIVQVALYKRWQRSDGTHRAIVAREGYASPEALLDTDASALKSWLMEVFEQKNVFALNTDISGLQFENYTYFVNGDKQFSSSSLEDLLTQILKTSSIQQIICLDPGKAFLGADLREHFRNKNVAVADIFEMDPALSWFWPTQKSKLAQEN